MDQRNEEEDDQPANGSKDIVRGANHMDGERPKENKYAL